MYHQLSAKSQHYYAYIDLGANDFDFNGFDIDKIYIQKYIFPSGSNASNSLPNKV